MRVVIQKSLESYVTVDDKRIGEIDKGFVLLVGFNHEDTEADIDYCVRKISKMRLFEDDDDKINLDLEAVSGKLLSISQFTLYANTKKGNRPSFIEAAKPDVAEEFYHLFNKKLSAAGFEVETGQFGAMMQVHIQNDGPVTILLDSQNR